MSLSVHLFNLIVNCLKAVLQVLFMFFVFVFWFSFFEGFLFVCLFVCLSFSETGFFCIALAVLELTL